VSVVGAMLAGEAEAVALLADLVARTGADPASTSHAHLPYRAVKRSLAAEEAERPHRFGKSELFRRPLPSEAIDALVGTFAGQRRSEINFIPLGGAYNRVPAGATAFVHRDERFLIEHVASTASPWVARSWACVHPWGSGRVYPNFPDPSSRTGTRPTTRATASACCASSGLRSAERLSLPALTGVPSSVAAGAGGKSSPVSGSTSCGPSSVISTTRAGMVNWWLHTSGATRWASGHSPAPRDASAGARRLAREHHPFGQGPASTTAQLGPV